MDIATIFGLVAGFGLVVGSIVTKSGSGAFLNVPSAMVTLGGMLAATMVHFSMGQFLKIFSVVNKTLFHKLPGEQDLIQSMVDYAAINRRDGALALEEKLQQVNDPFLIKGVQMVIDGLEEDLIEKQLALEITYLRERHANGKKIMEFMGSAAPAFGMIGTLIGLVQMLQSLDNVEMIGSGMATALLTTFYGALTANLICIPLAGKLELRSKEEGLQKEMMLEGILAIVRGEGPTSVRERMQAFLSAKHREDLKPQV